MKKITFILIVCLFGAIVISPGNSYAKLFFEDEKLKSENVSLESEISDDVKPDYLEIIGQIGGQVNAVFGLENYLFINIGPKIVILNVSDPLTPIEIGSTEPLPVYEINDIVVEGNFAYIGTYNGIFVIDVTDYTEPKLIQNIIPESHLFDIEISGTKAYAAANYDGLLIFDITNPSSISLISSVDTNQAYDVAVRGDYAYIADTGSGLRIIDISDPFFPILVGGISEGFGSSIWAIDVTENHAFVIAQPGIYSIDISTPTSPLIISSYVPGGIGGTSDIRIIDSLAFVANQGLSIIDISNPESMNRIGYLDTPGYAINLSKVESTIYLGSGHAGVEIVDTSTITNPFLVSSYLSVGSLNDVDTEGDLVYTIESSLNTMRILDISNPQTPELLGKFISQENLYKIKVSDSIAYLGERYGLRIIDVSDPYFPQELSYLSLGIVYGIEVRNNLVYAVGEKLWVIDITNINLPQLVGLYNLPSEARDIVIQEDLAFIADTSSGLRIININNPSILFEWGSLDTNGYSHDIEIDGSTLYLADSIGWGKIIDISNPAQPVFVSNFCGETVTDIEFVDSEHFYANCGLDEIKIYDVSDINSIKYLGETGFISTNSLEIWDNFIIAASAGFGLGIFHHVESNDYFDDFTYYVDDHPPAGWLLIGSEDVLPIIKKISSVPFNRILEFPAAIGNYREKWVLYPDIVFSDEYTITFNTTIQSTNSERAGLTIAWNEDNNDRIDIHLNELTDEIEFRVTYSGSNPSNIVVNQLLSIPINALTKYWIRVEARDYGPGDGEVNVYLSTDNLNFLHMINATGLPDLTGITGFSTGGINLPRVYFDDLKIITPYPNNFCEPDLFQVAIFDQISYSGDCKLLDVGDYQNSSYFGISDNSISSIKVGLNVQVAVFEDENFAGKNELISYKDGDLSNNYIGNDQISSIIVYDRLPTPLLETPINNSAIPETQDVSLVWSYVNGSTAYDLELWGDTISLTNPCSMTNENTCFLGKLAPGGYYWRVKALNDIGLQSQWSELWKFNITDVLDNPIPTILSTDPPSINQGSEDFTLTVIGTNFIPESIIRWNGTDRTTNYINSQQLSTIIQAEDVLEVGVASVTVYNPPPGGGESNTVNFTIKAKKKPWTMMLYLAGDNNLYYYLNRSIENLEALPVNEDINIVVLSDQDRLNDSWKFLIQPGGEYILGENKWYLGEVNTGDPEVLSSFVSWAAEMYPADNYYLSVADHGRGTSGLAWDYSSSLDYLTLPELRSALNLATNSGEWKIDVLQFDACLMGMFEVAYQMKDYADYLVASQNLGWSVFSYDSYSTIEDGINSATLDFYEFSAVAEDVNVDTIPRDLAIHIADEYFNHPALLNYPRTISALDLSQIDVLNQAVNDLATALRNNVSVYKNNILNARNAAQKLDSRDYYKITQDDEYIDLFHLSEKLAIYVPESTVQIAADQVQSVIENQFVIAEFHQSGYMSFDFDIYWDLDNTHGVSIYYPPLPGTTDYTNYIDNSLFQFTSNNTWDEFLEDIFGVLGLPPEEDPVTTLPPMLDPFFSNYLPFIKK